MPIAESEDFSSLLAELTRSTGSHWADIFLESRCLLRTTLRSDGAFVTTETWDSGAGVRLVRPGRGAVLASSAGRPVPAAEAAAGRLKMGEDEPAASRGVRTRPGDVRAGPGGVRAVRGASRTGRARPEQEPPSDLAEWIDSEEETARAVLESLMEAIAEECGPASHIALEMTISGQAIAWQGSAGGSGLARDLRTGLVVDATVSGIDGEVRRRWAAANGAAMLASLDPAGKARAIDERRRRLGECAPPPHGELAVVLAPGSGGLLIHEAIGHLLEGDLLGGGGGSCLERFLKKGRSAAGVVPFSPLLTVHDDPAAIGGRGVYALDDEGVPPSRVTLVENGQVRGWVGDRWTSPGGNGHGRRQSHRDLPMPRLAGTIALPGPHDPEEIIRDTVRGIYLDEFRSGFCDPIAGEFTLIAAEGSLIEGGRLTAPVRDVVISGSVFEALAQIDRVGSDLAGDGGAHSCVRGGQAVATIVGAPTVRIARIRVNGMAPS